MEAQNLMELLRATVDLNTERRMAAEYQLTQMHNIIGFAPTILQIVMQATVEQPVRQAGAVYLKHLIKSCWLDYEAEPRNPMPFSIYEQDRAIIRGVIVEAIVRSPELIRAQLSVCMNHIISNDFPERWPQVVGNINNYLQDQDVNGWNGALVCLYELVKIQKTPMYEAMNSLMYTIYHLMTRLLADQSEQSVLLQKQILKIYYALTRDSLPLDLITKEIFSQWMEICRQVADRDVPDSSYLNDHERMEFPYWKTKKWALHILVRMFKRYGSPQNVISDRYQQFAEWYLPTFSQGVLDVLLKILDQYKNRVYVSPRVLTDILSYLKRAVSHAYTWKLIKPFVEPIILEVIFAIMSFTDSDQQLWESDPNEIIRLKFDILEVYDSPVTAAQSLLLYMCKKRKSIQPKAIATAIQIITLPNVDIKQKDGAMHMLGTLSDVVLKKAMYCDQMESILITYVIPEFQNTAGYMRARACWLMHCYCQMQINNPELLPEIMRLTTNALLTDKELPVKVQAAISLGMFLSCEPEAKHYVIRHIKEITKEVLAIIRGTENEDLTNVIQKIVCTFTEPLVPVATEICQHLATTFSQVLEYDNGSHAKAITAWSLLDTIDTLLREMQGHPEVLQNLHPIVINVVGQIFQHSVTDFYELTFLLVINITEKTIYPEMWQLLELIYKVFKTDTIDYFVNIMPALYNYVTVDTPAFLSNPNRLFAMYDMCQTMLTIRPGDYIEWYAAKLMEVIILKCKGQIDAVIHMFVALALSRLRSEVLSSELRSMCLQVVIAALYYNPQLLLSILDKMSQQGNVSISALFIKQWLHDIDCFLCIHDRKLCVLGLCTLISLGDAKPQVLSEVADKIAAAFILLFDGLKLAYESRAQKEEGADEEEEEEDEVGCEDPLSSDEDDIDMDEIGSEESNDDRNETDSESFTTPIDDGENETAIDEYWTFKEVITTLSTQDEAWYALLTCNLTPEQTMALQEVLVTANQRKAAKSQTFELNNN